MSNGITSGNGNNGGKTGYYVINAARATSNYWVDVDPGKNTLRLLAEPLGFSLDPKVSTILVDGRAYGIDEVIPFGTWITVTAAKLAGGANPFTALFAGAKKAASIGPDAQAFLAAVDADPVIGRIVVAMAAAAKGMIDGTPPGQAPVAADDGNIILTPAPAVPDEFEITLLLGEGYGKPFTVDRDVRTIGDLVLRTYRAIEGGKYGPDPSAYAIRVNDNINVKGDRAIRPGDRVTIVAQGVFA